MHTLPRAASTPPEILHNKTRLYWSFDRLTLSPSVLLMPFLSLQVHSKRPLGSVKKSILSQGRSTAQGNRRPTRRPTLAIWIVNELQAAVYRHIAYQDLPLQGVRLGAKIKTQPENVRHHLHVTRGNILYTSIMADDSCLTLRARG